MAAQSAADRFLDRLTSIPARVSKQNHEPLLHLIRQDFEALELGKSVIKTPMKIGTRDFKHGLGTHSFSHIRIYSPEPIARFSSLIGIDNNGSTGGERGSSTFTVRINGKGAYTSPVIKCGQEPVKVEIDAEGSRMIDLLVDDGGDGPGWDHADWADAKITTTGGKTLFLDEMKLGVPDIGSRYPFSFTYGDKASDELLDSWKQERTTKRLDSNRTAITTTFTDPQTGLKLHWEAVSYSDFPAVEWMLYFENTGKKDTPVIQNIQAMDLMLRSPINTKEPYRLHKTHGGTYDPQQFEATMAVVDSQHPESLGAESGRGSTKNFPFFKVETGEGSLIAAVGWSGNWLANFECPDQSQLHITAGMEKTHFLLHPGEKVRSPRMLVMFQPGDTLESNAGFRQLIFKHYAAKWKGKTPDPVPFCNTCFTRKGGWLNECNEENQISLINAYAPLGLEALLTDAGWFTGGWPMGAGNWDVRKDAYPHGMAPVAKAAKDKGMIYGLWYEPERVISGTTVHKEHPQWCLGSQKEPQETYLLNFGLPEVQDYFFDIVKGFMELPGFRVYRQDFNMDPLPYWRYNDQEDRQGITEIRYIEGLYAYWERIGKTWPDALMEECASGGHRMDLETVMRMHIHQKTDYWFDNEVDQASIWGLSQYLPNSTFVAPIDRMDDYTFHSVMASSLCLGWIADAPDFDAARGKKLLSRYREVRHLLVGAWYPLLPYSRDLSQWMASQYHRPDLNEGMILAFRREQSPYRSVDVTLHGLRPDAEYELSFDSTGKKIKARGSELMKSIQIELAERHSSDLIIYRAVK